MDRSPSTLARTADAAHRTGAFSWLVTHRPTSLVVRLVPIVEVAPIIPGSTVFAAGSHPCLEAKTDRAELLVIAPERSAERERALDCGFAIFHDAGAAVIAPL